MQSFFFVRRQEKCKSGVNSGICDAIGQNDTPRFLIDPKVQNKVDNSIDHQEEVCISLERVLTEIVEASQNNGDENDRLKKQLASREKQIDNLIDQLSEGDLTEAAQNRIKVKINSITEETARLTEAINEK